MSKQSNRWKAFEAELDLLMRKERIPGVAVAVSLNGETIYERGFGVKNLAAADPVTPDTLFGIASVTKSFTALAIMKLAEEGKLSPDTPVIDILPEFRLPAQPQMEKIRIRHLLTHTTGQPPMRRREELVRFEEHLRYLAEEPMELLGEPGQYLSYCNDTFLLLGAIIERVTGQPYREYMTETVLKPLGMERSTFDLDAVLRDENATTPYVKNERTGELAEAAWPTLGNYQVGGGIRSTVRDLIKYGNLYVNDGVTADGYRLIGSESLRQMREPLHPVEPGSYYGYALMITPDYAGYTLVEHSGGQAGVSSNFGYVPEVGLAVAVLTNLSNVSAGQIWLSAVNCALGLPLNKRRREWTGAPPADDQIDKLLGVYRTAEYGDLAIRRENGALQLKAAGTPPADLRAVAADVLLLEQRGMPIRFLFDDHGQVWAAFYQKRIWKRVQ